MNTKADHMVHKPIKIRKITLIGHGAQIKVEMGLHSAIIFWTFLDNFENFGKFS